VTVLNYLDDRWEIVGYQNGIQYSPFPVPMHGLPTRFWRNQWNQRWNLPLFIIYIQLFGIPCHPNFIYWFLLLNPKQLHLLF